MEPKYSESLVCLFSAQKKKKKKKECAKSKSNDIARRGRNKLHRGISFNVANEE
jgi:hypothetical protein